MACDHSSQVVAIPITWLKSDIFRFILGMGHNSFS